MGIYVFLGFGDLGGQDVDTRNTSGQSVLTVASWLSSLALALSQSFNRTAVASWEDKNRRLYRKRENRILKWLGLSLLLGAALADVAWAQGSTKFDGQYVGQLTLTKVVSGDCTRPPSGALYPLTISGGQVQFKYIPRFDTILTGKVDDDGAFKASRRLRGGLVSMTGHIQGNNIIAFIDSPSCKYTFKTGE